MNISKILTPLLLSMIGFAIAKVWAQSPDPATLFGMRESIEGVSLSPDGTRVAYIAPEAGQGAAIYMVDLASGNSTRLVGVDGHPQRIRWCEWSDKDRLVCDVYGTVGGRTERFAALGKYVSFDIDGKKLKSFGGGIIDWLSSKDGKILVSSGGGVVRLDTRTLIQTQIEPRKDNAGEYITDGQGVVRIMGIRRGDSGYDGQIVYYSYRPKGSRDWKPLGKYNILTRDGINPYAVDPVTDTAYVFKKLDGRTALYRMALDGSMREDLVLFDPQVDIDSLIYLGGTRRVVGASFVTDKRQTVFFDPQLAKLATQLSKALPNLPQVTIVGASSDESKLLLWAGSDSDPGRYYLYEKATHGLRELMLARPQLEGVKLASVKPITYRAADGTIIPAYLTLPPGKDDAHGLPAIVMPHGGPGSRDEWGFDWLSQFYAARGYAVLQPEFRGSTGYGDAWFEKNGFQSWRLAVGDVVDGGRWLVSSGLADPKRLAIVGWSYGGYAALQANVIDADLFKAVVAIAPVTDLTLLGEQARGWSDFLIEKTVIGVGPHILEGSPAKHAEVFKAPVLIFQGTVDENVDPDHARLMDSKLAAAGKRHELILYPNLDHYLMDSKIRADMLSKSETFLRKNWPDER